MSPPIDDKIKAKIKALLNQAESEAREQTDSGTGESLSANTGAALLYAKKARELAEKYHLELSEIANQKDKPLDYIPPTTDITTIINPLHRSNARIRPRMIWFEDLAQIVAKAYYCRAGVDYSGNVFIVGLDFDRELAEQVFLNLAEVAFRLCPIERNKTQKSIGMPSFKQTIYTELKEWPGEEIFDNSFHAGFREQLEEIYAENGQDTSSIAADEFLEKNYPSPVAGVYYYYSCDNNTNYYGFDKSGNLWPELQINEICKKIGKMAARFTTKKVAATKEQAISQQQSLIKQQSIAKNNQDSTEIIVLLDASGSMYEDLMEEAKKGAINYAKEVLKDEKTSIGLVAFDHKIRKNLLPSKDLGKFIETANPVLGLGSTDMVLAFNQARMNLKRRNARQVIMLITDGIPDDQTKTLSVANNIKRQGIEIMAIGTSGCNQAFLDKITSKKGLGLLVSNSEFGEGIKRMAGMLTA